jgi:ferredoxin
MRIKIDRELCIGCGSCASTASKTFKVDLEGRAVVIDDYGDDDETIKMAIESCPVQAITMDEEK